MCSHSPDLFSYTNASFERIIVTIVATDIGLWLGEEIDHLLFFCCHRLQRELYRSCTHALYSFVSSSPSTYSVIELIARMLLLSASTTSIIVVEKRLPQHLVGGLVIGLILLSASIAGILVTEMRLPQHHNLPDPPPPPCIFAPSSSHSSHYCSLSLASRCSQSCIALPPN